MFFIKKLFLIGVRPTLKHTSSSKRTIKTDNKTTGLIGSFGRDDVNAGSQNPN